MTIAVQCSCGKLLRVKAELAGRRVKCPGCGNALTVPSPTAVEAGAPATMETAPAASTPAVAGPKAAPEKVKPAAAPPAPSPKAAPRPWWAGAAAVLGVLLLGSILAAGWFFVEARTLQGQLADAEQTVSSRAALEQRKQDASAALEALQKRIANAEEKARETAAQALALQKQVADAQRQAKDADGQLKNVQKQLETAQHQERAAAAKADALQKQLAALAPAKPKEGEPAKEKPSDAKKIEAITKERLLGNWESTLTDGTTVGLWFNDNLKIVAVSVLAPGIDRAKAREAAEWASGGGGRGLSGGGFGIDSMEYKVDAGKNEVKIWGDEAWSAVAKPTKDGALLVSGRFKANNLNFNMPETRFQRVKPSEPANKTQTPTAPAQFTFQERRSLEKQEGTFSTANLVVSPDSKQALTSGDQGRIYLWNLETGKPLHSFVGHEGYQILALAFSADGQHFLSAAYDGRVCLWDAKTRKEVLKFEGHRTGGTFKSAGKDNYDNAAHQLLFSPNGKFVLSCSRAQAWLWDATTGKPIQALGQKGLSFFRAVFSHDGRWILASILKEESVTCEVGVWDAETGKEVRRLAGSFKGEHLIDHLAVTPSGKHLVACSRDGTIRTWEIESGKEIKRVPVTVKDRLMGFALALDGRLALTWEHKHVKKWTSERIELGGGRFEVRATERPMPEGDPTVYLWDVESGKRIASKPYKGYLGRAVFSPDGQQLLLGDYGPVQMWELVKGVEEKPPQEDPKGPSPKKDAGKTGPAELGSLPKAKGPRLVELAKPPEGVTLQGIYLAGAFERTKRAKDWPQAFPSGTEEVYIVVVFQGLPFGTQVAAEVTAAAGPVRLAPSTVRTIQTGAEIVIELTCAAEKGAYADGDYKTTVLINRTAVAELNWCVGGREPTGNAVALAGTSWQSRYGDGSGYELRFGAGGKLDVLSLSSGSGKSSWKAKKGTWQQNGARFSGFADLDGPKRQRIEVKGRFVDDDLGAKIRNENEGPPGGFGNWYELPLFKKK